MNTPDVSEESQVMTVDRTLPTGILPVHDSSSITKEP